MILKSCIQWCLLKSFTSAWYFNRIYHARVSTDIRDFPQPSNVLWNSDFLTHLSKPIRDKYWKTRIISQEYLLLGLGIYKLAWGFKMIQWEPNFLAWKESSINLNICLWMRVWTRPSNVPPQPRELPASWAASRAVWAAGFYPSCLSTWDPICSTVSSSGDSAQDMDLLE